MAALHAGIAHIAGAANAPTPIPGAGASLAHQAGALVASGLVAARGGIRKAAAAQPGMRRAGGLAHSRRGLLCGIQRRDPIWQREWEPAGNISQRAGRFPLDAHRDADGYAVSLSYAAPDANGHAKTDSHTEADCYAVARAQPDAVTFAITNTQLDTNTRAITDAGTQSNAGTRKQSDTDSNG